MMSIKAFIKENTQKKQNTETVSLRLPSPLLGKIDELASTINVNRQDLLYEFVAEGLKTALKVYDETENVPDPDILNTMENKAEGPRYYILNTNINNDEDTHEDMLSNGIAAAFCDPWKFNINRLNKGDIIFLYQSGLGIVAYGTASGNLEIQGEKHWQKLDDFQRVVPLQARDIKRVIKSNLVFLKVMFKIPNEFGLLIKNNLTHLN